MERRTVTARYREREKCSFTLDLGKQATEQHEIAMHTVYRYISTEFNVGNILLMYLYRHNFKLFFFILYTCQAKDDIDISSDSSSSYEDTAIGAYWDSNVGLPFTDRVSEEEF